MVRKLLMIPILSIVMAGAVASHTSPPVVIAMGILCFIVISVSPIGETGEEKS